MRKDLSLRYVLAIVSFLMFAFATQVSASEASYLEQTSKMEVNGNPQYDAVMHGKMYLNLIAQTRDYVYRAANSVNNIGLSTQLTVFANTLHILGTNLSNKIIKIIVKNVSNRTLSENMVVFETIEFQHLLRLYRALNIKPRDLELAMENITKYQRQLLYLVDNFSYATSTTGNTWRCLAHTVGPQYLQFTHIGSTRELATLKTLSLCYDATHTSCKITACNVIHVAF